MHRRTSTLALITALCATALCVASFCILALSPATAQTYPNKPIKLLLPFGIGGATDLYARTLGAAMSVELGQPIVVEARPGVGGLTGVDAVAKSPPDGYTLCFAGVAALSAIPF